MVAANPILFKTAADLTQETGVATKKGEHPDHIVVIKHVPAVGDSKRAIDEYYSELLMGGRNVMVSRFTSHLHLLTWTEHFQRVRGLAFGHATHLRPGHPRRADDSHHIPSGR